MSSARNEGIEDVNADVNDLAVQYIIPVSVIVGVILAAITIGCVCYRRWRFVIRSRQSKVLINSNNQPASDLVKQNGNKSKQQQK